MSALGFFHPFFHPVILPVRTSTGRRAGPYTLFQNVTESDTSNVGTEDGPELDPDLMARADGKGEGTDEEQLQLARK